MKRLERCRANGTASGQLLNDNLAVGQTTQPDVRVALPDEFQSGDQGLILGFVIGAGRSADTTRCKDRPIQRTDNDAEAGDAAGRKTGRTVDL